MYHSVVVAIAWYRMIRDVVVLARPSVQLCYLSAGRYTNFTNDKSVIERVSAFSKTYTKVAWDYVSHQVQVAEVLSRILLSPLLPSHLKSSKIHLLHSQPS